MPNKTATDILRRRFICIGYRRTPGRIARVKSVTIDIAEKKKLTLLFRLELQTPEVAPQNASMGWHMLAMPIMKTTLAIS